MTMAVSNALPNRVPVSIVTGFLGAGKTTLINFLVTRPGMEETALIVNEFGEIGLDNLLVETSIENTLVLENGCICCSIRGDLIDTIIDLFAKVQNRSVPRFSRILIETTGLADPGPIVESIRGEAAIASRCHLECVVTIVDGVQGQAQMSRHEEAVIQIAQADIALLSKSDLATPDAIDALEDDINRINPTLIVKRIEHGKVDPEFLFQASADRLVRRPPDGRHHHRSHHDHGEVSTWSLVHDAPIDEDRLRGWLSMIYTLRPFALLRMKGLIRLENSNQPLLLQAVGNMFSPPEWLDGWPGDLPRTHMVLIFKGLDADAIEKSFQTHVLSGSGRIN